MQALAAHLQAGAGPIGPIAVFLYSNQRHDGSAVEGKCVCPFAYSWRRGRDRGAGGGDGRADGAENCPAIDRFQTMGPSDWAGFASCPFSFLAL